MKRELISLTKDLNNFAAKNSPSILTGLSIAGMVSTTVMAVHATPKALQLLSLEEERRGAYLTKWETVKLLWPQYLPTVVMGGISIGCAISANSIHLQRKAAIAGLYSMTEASLREYQNKVKETIGEKKEQKIRDDVVLDKIMANPVNEKDVILTGKGNTLCYDAWTGRYFKSDIEAIRKVENIVNNNLLQDDFISLNDVYYELNLDEVELGNEIGWRVDDGLVFFDFTSQLNSDGVPCLVLNFKLKPRYDYM